MNALKRTQIGHSVSAIPPKKALARLKVHRRELLYLSEAVSGARPTPQGLEVGEQMDAARGILKKRRALLHEQANGRGTRPTAAPVALAERRPAAGCSVRTIRQARRPTRHA